MKEIIPNVTAVVLVYATLAIPTNITAEAALSFLGVGVRDPTPSWGQMLNQSQTNNWYQLDPWFLHRARRHAVAHGDGVQPARRRRARRP